MYRKYLKTYIQLVRKRENDPIKGHKHHVFPVSIFNKNPYIVNLTPREHFIAHRLLAKIFELRYGLQNNKTKKMKHAFGRMLGYSEIKNNSRMYSLGCKALSEAMQSSNNPMKNPKLAKFVGLKVKQIMANKSDEEKKDLGNKISEGLKHRKTPAPKCSEETKRKLSKLAKERYSKLSDKEKEKICKRNSKAGKKWWEEKTKNNTPEELKSYHQLLGKSRFHYEYLLTNLDGSTVEIKHFPNWCKENGIKHIGNERTRLTKQGRLIKTKKVKPTK